MRFHVAMKLVQLPLLLAGLVLPFTTMLTAASQNTKDDYLVYIGTYTGKGSEGSRGIYVYRFDSSSGKLTPADEFALRATLKTAPDGNRVATPFPRQDSSMLTPLASAECLIIREIHAPAAKAGSPCRITKLPL